MTFQSRPGLRVEEVISKGGPEAQKSLKKKLKSLLARYRLLGLALELRDLRRVGRGVGRRMLRIDRRNIKKYLSTHEVRRLHLGAGEHTIEGWLNSDIFPVGSEIFIDASRPFPIEGSTFDYIFSEHMIEHVPYQDGIRMLSECYRVLKPGGRIRIATPNLAFLINLYRAEKSAAEENYIAWHVTKWDPDAGYSGSVFVINDFFRLWGHQFIYDEAALGRALGRAGFRDVVALPLSDSPDENLRGLENARVRPEGFLALETLVLEGRKP